MIIDIHNHTIYRSYDSVLKPEELIDRAKQLGLDAVCITEHDFFWEPGAVEEFAVEHGFLVLPGVEINTEDGHILVFGLERYIYGMHKTAFLKRIVDEVGGAMILAHPARRRLYPEDTVEAAVARAYQSGVFELVDGIEILNSRATDAENNFAASLNQKLGLRATGGSDSHGAWEVGRCATVFEQPVTCLQDLITEIKEGRFSPIDLRKKEPLG